MADRHAVEQAMEISLTCGLYWEEFTPMGREQVVVGGQSKGYSCPGGTNTCKREAILIREKTGYCNRKTALEEVGT